MSMQRFLRMVPLLCLVLTACNRLHHTPVTFSADTPAYWQEAPAGEKPVPFHWCDFNDPELDAWITRVLNSNHDITQATLRLEQAERSLERTEDERLPVMSASLNSSANRAPAGTTWSRGSTAQAGINVTPDLSGGQESQVQGARFNRDEAEHSRASVRQNLMVSAAELYWGLALTNERIRINEHSLLAANKLLAITRARHEAGQLAELDVAQALQNQLDQQIQLQALQNEKRHRQRAQAVLLGVPPDRRLIDPQTLPLQPLPSVSAGIPAYVLARRPDLQAAQTRLQAANTRIDIAYANFYPTLSLTASAGSSMALLRYIAEPALALGAGLNLTFLQWQQRTADLNEAKNQYQQLSADWQQALYQAMADIENGLSERVYLQKQAQQLRQALVVARDAEHISQARYEAGTITVNIWTDEQMRRRQAELALSTNRYEQLYNLAKLWRDLGGDAALPVSPGQG